MPTFNLKITSPTADCNSADYFFRTVATNETLQIGESTFVEVVGGVPPYTWTMLSPGSTLDEAETIDPTNRVNCNAYSGDGTIRYTVTDSCGTEVQGQLGLEDYISVECLSGDCAAAAKMVISPGANVDVNAIEEGDTFTVTGGIAPYRWRITDGSYSGSTPMTITGFYGILTTNIDITIQCIDMCGRRVTLEGRRVAPPEPVIAPWTPQPGEKVTYTFGCDDDPRWEIDCGEINRKTGEIVNFDGCECFEDITVTVDDGCSNPVSSTEHYQDVTKPVLNGNDECSVGNIYSATGGFEPYVYSFDSGSINPETGEILSINECGDPGTSRAGIVTVTDACNREASLDVRLPDGVWIEIDAKEAPNPLTGVCQVVSAHCSQQIDYSAITNAGWEKLGGYNPDCWINDAISGTTKYHQYGDLAVYKTEYPEHYVASDIICTQVKEGYPELNPDWYLYWAGSEEVLGFNYVTNYHCCSTTHYRIAVAGWKQYTWQCP